VMGQGDGSEFVKRRTPGYRLSKAIAQNKQQTRPACARLSNGSDRVKNICDADRSWAKPKVKSEPLTIGDNVRASACTVTNILFAKAREDFDSAAAEM